MNAQSSVLGSRRRFPVSLLQTLYSCHVKPLQHFSRKNVKHVPVVDEVTIAVE